jgi:hypothetical protein
MASAAALSARSDLPARRPVASEPGFDLQPGPTVRQAFGTDIVGSTLSPGAQLGYRVLVDHVNRGRDPRRPYDGQVFLTDETFGAELGGVSKRKVQRIRSELLAGGWICFPKGDAGGRGNNTIWYHLHPDGRPCSHASQTPLRQREAADQANALRAAKRLRAEKDDKAVILCAEVGLSKDDSGVIVSGQRMTEPTIKDDRNVVKDDKNDIAYKEELLQELIPEPKSASTATSKSDEFPPEFARLMDQEIELDDGALRRLWQGARAILPDASAEEIRLFFHQRACRVYRNRKLENPTGLMLATVQDWFSCRRVLEHREAVQLAAEAMPEIQRQIADQLAALTKKSSQQPAAGK